MDLATFHELLSPRGQVAIAEAEALLPTEASFLACYEKLRKHHEAVLAKAALETVLFRRKAREKFADAGRMYFTREALEQATGEIAARHRAKRFAPFGVVADLCCGIGGDALALAHAGLTVHAVEIDPLRLAMAKANATVLGLSDRITFHDGDALTVALPEVSAAFADPSRRAERRRYLDPEESTPSLSSVRSRFPSGFPLAVKIAPGVARECIAGLDAEVEFVSVAGELRECVLWLGPFRTASRRATVLPSGASLCGEESSLHPPVVAPGPYIFDPDASVVRAGLAGALANAVNLSLVDHEVMLLTGHEAIISPFLTAYRVELASRFHVSRLRECLRSHNVGRVTVVKRGSRIDADELLRRLKLVGTEHRVVILTRAAGEQTMIVCERC